MQQKLLCQRINAQVKEIGHRVCSTDKKKLRVSIAHIEYSLNFLLLLNREASKRKVYTFHVYTDAHLDSEIETEKLNFFAWLFIASFLNYHIHQVYKKRNQFQKFLICLVYKPTFDWNTIFKLNYKNWLVLKE